MLALKGGIQNYRLPGREVMPGVRMGINVSWNPERVTLRGPVLIGGSTSLGDGTVIEGPTLIGAGSVIEPGATISGCILGEYTRVSSVARLENILVFGPNCINPDGSYLDIGETQLGWLVDDARRKSALTETGQRLTDVARDLNNPNG